MPTQVLAELNEGTVSCDEITEAIDRKRQIVDYHIECLEGLVPRVDSRTPVPIPIQAHFEGVVVSVIACADQIAAGLWQVSKLGKERGGLDKSFESHHAETVENNEHLAALQKVWFSGEMQDVREVRRRAAHLYYDKDDSGEHYYVRPYEVNPKRVQSGGPIRNRELLSFSFVGLDLVKEIASQGISGLRSLH